MSRNEVCGEAKLGNTSFLFARLGSNNISLAVVGQGTPEVSVHEKLTLDSNTVQNFRKLKRAIKGYINSQNVEVNYAAVSLSRELVAFAVIDLPVAERKYLREAVEDKLEKHFPCNKDDLVFDCRELAAVDGQMKVLVTTAKKCVIEPLVKAIEEEGLPVQLVEPEPVSRWHGFQSGNFQSGDFQSEDIAGLVYRDDDGYGVDFFDGHDLLMSVSGAHCGVDCGIVDGSVREFQKKLPSFNVPRLWFAEEKVDVSDERYSFQTAGFPEMAVEKGIARGLERHHKGINLWRKSVGKRTSILYLAASIVVMGLALYFWINYCFIKLDKKKEYLRNLSSVVQEQQNIIEKNSKLELAFGQAQEPSANMEMLYDERVSTVNILREIKDIMPPAIRGQENMWLESFLFKQGGDMRYVLKLKIIAPKGEEFALRERFGKSEMFENVKVKSAQESVFHVEVTVKKK